MDSLKKNGLHIEEIYPAADLKKRTNRAGLAYQCLDCFGVHMLNETKIWKVGNEIESRSLVPLQWYNDDYDVHSQTRVITLPQFRVFIIMHSLFQ